MLPNKDVRGGGIRPLYVRVTKIDLFVRVLRFSSIGKMGLGETVTTLDFHFRGLDMTALRSPKVKYFADSESPTSTSK